MNITEKMLLVIIVIMILGLYLAWKTMQAIDHFIWSPKEIVLYEAESGETQ